MWNFSKQPGGSKDSAAVCVCVRWAVRHHQEGRPVRAELGWCVSTDMNCFVVLVPHRASFFFFFFLVCNGRRSRFNQVDSH